MKPETRLQVDFVSWLRKTYPDLLFTSTQAGDRRSALAAIMMKRMGYTSGSPDIIVFKAKQGWSGLLLELKTKDGKPSDAQNKFMLRACEAGYKYVFAYGLDQAQDQLIRYMEGK